MSSPSFVILKEDSVPFSPDSSNHVYTIVKDSFANQAEATRWLVDEIKGERLSKYETYYLGVFTTCIKGSPQKVEDLSTGDIKPPVKWIDAPVVPEAMVITNVQEATEVLSDPPAIIPAEQSVVEPSASSNVLTRGEEFYW